MNTRPNHKPLSNVLLETLASRTGLRVDLKSFKLKTLGKLNLEVFSYLIWNTTTQENYPDPIYNDMAELKIIASLSLEMENVRHYFKITTGGDKIYLPNLRPVDHFKEGEEVYVSVADFVSARQADFKELGFIRTTIEYKAKDSHFLKLKTLDYLPDGHSFSTGNSGGHCSINFGRILKIAEWDFLKAAVNSDPEFVDLFRANGVGSFANLELYDLSNFRTTVT